MSYTAAIRNSKGFAYTLRGEGKPVRVSPYFDSVLDLMTCNALSWRDHGLDEHRIPLEMNPIREIDWEVYRHFTLSLPDHMKYRIVAEAKERSRLFEE
jgi:hypothetical protein